MSGRGQIVELLREREMSEVELPDDWPDRPWTDVVADIMRAYRRSYARYPRLIPLLTTHPVNNIQALTMYNMLAAILRRGGFDAADTLRIITVLDSFVLGSVLDLTAPEEPWGSGPEVGPELAAALNTAAGDPTRADDAFEFGLAALLRGLSAFPASVAPGPA